MTSRANITVRGTLLLLLGLTASAPLGATPWDEGVWAAWMQCRQQGSDLTAQRTALFGLADSLATARQEAAERQDRTLERRLLAQGEAVAESIRAVATAALAQELQCTRLRQELLERLDSWQASLLRAGAGSRDSSAVDSVLRLRGQLQAQEPPGVAAELSAPVAADDDPPEVLRLKAAYARDVIDRIERWRGLVLDEQRALASERLQAEARDLARDERFYDERAALEMHASPADEFSPARGRRGLLRVLISQMPDMAGREVSADEILDSLEQWLTARRSMLESRIAELEREAVRRESE